MLKRCKNISAGGWPYNICDIWTSQWMSNCDAKKWETTEKKGKQHAQKRDKKITLNACVWERERESAYGNTNTIWQQFSYKFIIKQDKMRCNLGREHLDISFMMTASIECRNVH